MHLLEFARTFIGSHCKSGRYYAFLCPFCRNEGRDMIIRRNLGLYICLDCHRKGDLRTLIWELLSSGIKNHCSRDKYEELAFPYLHIFCDLWSDAVDQFDGNIDMKEFLSKISSAAKLQEQEFQELRRRKIAARAAKYREMNEVDL